MKNIDLLKVLPCYPCQRSCQVERKVALRTVLNKSAPAPATAQHTLRSQEMKLATGHD